jgi:hypothetical protein
MLIVNASRSTMFQYVYVAFLREIATQGGLEQQMPPQATVIAFGFPSLS